jgi:hypothetical protein
MTDTDPCVYRFKNEEGDNCELYASDLPEPYASAPRILAAAKNLATHYAKVWRDVVPPPSSIREFQALMQTIEPGWSP